MKLDVRGFLEKSIKDYCELNRIEDIDAFSKRCLQQGFNIVKFGTSPYDNIQREIKGINDIEKVKNAKRSEKSIAEKTRKTVNIKERTDDEQERKVSTVEKTETKKPVIVRKIQIRKKTL